MASFDIVTPSEGDRGYDSRRQLHKKQKHPYTAGRARSLLSVILSPQRAKLPDMMGAIGQVEDREATAVYAIGKDTCMSSLEAFLPEDLE